MVGAAAAHHQNVVIPPTSDLGDDLSGPGFPRRRNGSWSRSVAGRSRIGPVAAITGTRNLFASVTTIDREEPYSFLTTTVAALPGLQACTSTAVRHTFKAASARPPRQRSAGPQQGPGGRIWRCSAPRPGSRPNSGPRDEPSQVPAEVGPALRHAGRCALRARSGAGSAGSGPVVPTSSGSGGSATGGSTRSGSPWRSTSRWHFEPGCRGQWGWCQSVRPLSPTSAR